MEEVARETGDKQQRMECGMCDRKVPFLIFMPAYFLTVNAVLLNLQGIMQHAVELCAGCHY